MKFIHSIGKRWENDQVEALASFGINVKYDEFSYINVESDVFERIRKIVMRPNRIYAAGAVFDKAEINQAKWLALMGFASFGFPQPDGTFDFLNVVYDAATRCKTCGIVDGKQKNPFRIKSDKTKLLAFHLEWINDEIFVKRHVYEDLFSPLGIGFWPVLIHRSGEVSQQLVQLDLPICDWSFAMEGMPFEICEECRRKKYQVRPLDFLPPINGEVPNQIFRGREFYGSGGQADRRMYISQDLRQELLKRKIAKWHQFYPLKV